MAKKLGFDATDADTLAASDFVGSHLYAGGTKLTKTQVGAKEALDVYVANGLTVDLDGVYDGGTNTNPDNMGLIGHTRAATPADTDQVERVTVGAGSSDDVVAANVHGLDVMSFGMVFDGTTWDRLRGTSGAVHVSDAGGSLTVDASDLDIRDLTAASDSVQAWAHDGSGNAITSSSSALDVNIQSTDAITFTVSDAALANTAYATTAVALDDTENSVVASALANRKYWHGFNNDNKAVEIISTGEAYGDGFPIHPGVYISFRAGPAIDFLAIGPTGSSALDFRVLELS